MVANGSFVVSLTLLQSAGGIGLGAANSLAASGARAVIFADIDFERVQESATASKAYATNPEYEARAYQIDVTSVESVNAVFAKAIEEFGRLDYLVNSAGVCHLPNRALPQR